MSAAPIDPRVASGTAEEVSAASIDTSATTGAAINKEEEKILFETESRASKDLAKYFHSFAGKPAPENPISPKPEKGMLFREAATYFLFPGTGRAPRAQADSTKQLKTTDGNIVEYIPIHTPGSNIVVFVCHGRGRDMAPRSVSQWVEMATAQNASIILHNYPGYGGTTGHPSFNRVTDNALAVLKHCIEFEECIQDKEILFLGNSVGTGLAMWLAAHAKERLGEGVQIKNHKVVLISPYTSVWAIAGYWFSTQFPLKQIFRTAQRCLPEFLQPNVGRPDGMWFMQGCSTDPFPTLKLAEHMQGKEVLILHGEDDTVILPAHGRAIEEKLRELGVTTTFFEVPKTTHKDTRIRGDMLIWAFAHSQGKDKMSQAMEFIKAKDWNGEKDTPASDGGAD